MKRKHVDPKKVLSRLEEAETLLDDQSTSKAKFNALRKLIKGLNPKLDQKLQQVNQVLNKIDKYKQGKIIELSAEHLPEKTKVQKRRKKALLLLLARWKSLKSEINRTKIEIQKNTGPNTSLSSQASTAAKLLATAKGPLGAITLTAAVIATGLVILQNQAVTITVHNQNCQTIEPSGVNIDLPGLKLPTQPIPPGGSTTLTLPPIRFTVDTTHPTTIGLSALSLDFTFDRRDRGGDIVFNDQSLLGRQTTINLNTQKNHTLTLSCS